jgi:hypothetical protein
MRKLYYMSLEPYKDRYTLQLLEWNKRVFDTRGLDVVYVPGLTLNNSQKIVVGQVLDAHGRSYFGMSQIMNLVRLMQQGEVTNEDVIFFEDMFQPGFESLGYIINQVPPQHCPRIFVRCLAQTIDPDDFVHVWNMEKWMSLYEKMVNEIVEFSGGAVLATNEEMVAHMRIAGWTAPIYNISGLAFGKDEVRERIVGELKPFSERTMRVGFAARTDQEKQPHFYLDLIETWHNKHKNDPAFSKVEFSIFSGSELRGNDQTAINRIKDFKGLGLITVYSNLEKNEYYNLLNDSRVLLNTALQDWVSNTVSEADTLGCNVLYPAYRSFPETFANDHERLYIPWSLTDAINKLEKLLLAPHKNIGKISDWNNGTVDRTIDIITGSGEQWARNSIDYRKYVPTAKYN